MHNAGGELPRILLPRTRVNKRKEDSGFGKPRRLVDSPGAGFWNAREGAPTIREAMWSAWQGPGLGHLRLAVRESGVVADGLVLGVTDGRPLRLSYEVRCDPYWRVRAARVGVPGEPPRVELLSDGEGNWSGSDGRTVSYLKGCEYVDISETPFTNTLPIRRLGLAPGGSAEITVAYFEGAELQPWPEPQRYTRLETGDGGLTYRFVSLGGGFSADLPVDQDGLVLDYSGLFRRAFP
jgi:uncharacterized protein